MTDNKQIKEMPICVNCVHAIPEDKFPDDI